MNREVFELDPSLLKCRYNNANDSKIGFTHDYCMCIK
jgi:hypothetical protein